MTTTVTPQLEWHLIMYPHTLHFSSNLSLTRVNTFSTNPSHDNLTIFYTKIFFWQNDHQQQEMKTMNWVWIPLHVIGFMKCCWSVWPSLAMYTLLPVSPLWCSCFGLAFGKFCSFTSLCILAVNLKLQSWISARSSQRPVGVFTTLCIRGRSRHQMSQDQGEKCIPCPAHESNPSGRLLVINASQSDWNINSFQLNLFCLRRESFTSIFTRMFSTTHVTGDRLQKSSVDRLIAVYLERVSPERK